MPYLEDADYFVRVIDFPSYKVGGMTIPNDDGTFSVYINDRLDVCRKRRAGNHELNHIERGDFYNDSAIGEIENL